MRIAHHVSVLKMSINALLKARYELTMEEQFNCLYRRYKLLEARIYGPKRKWKRVVMSMRHALLNEINGCKVRRVNVAEVTLKRKTGVTRLPKSDLLSSSSPSSAQLPTPPPSLPTNAVVDSVHRHRRGRVTLDTHAFCVGTWNPGTISNGNALQAQEMMLEKSIHALAIQETRLESDGARPADLLPKFRWFGRARPKDERSTSNNRGGGVGWLISSNLCVRAVAGVGGVDGHCERHWLELELSDGPLFLCSVYWRPGVKVNPSAWFCGRAHLSRLGKPNERDECLFLSNV